MEEAHQSYFFVNVLVELSYVVDPGLNVLLCLSLVASQTLLIEKVRVDCGEEALEIERCGLLFPYVFETVKQFLAILHHASVHLI